MVARKGRTRGADQHAVIVAKQQQRVVAGDHQVKPAIVVIVAPRRAHADDSGIRKIFHLLKLAIA